MNLNLCLRLYEVFTSSRLCYILEEEMDGRAVLGALGCEVGPDYLKTILPKYGQRIKVYNCIKSAVGTAPVQKAASF